MTAQISQTISSDKSSISITRLSSDTSDTSIVCLLTCNITVPTRTSLKCYLVGFQGFQGFQGLQGSDIFLPLRDPSEKPASFLWNSLMEDHKGKKALDLLHFGPKLRPEISRLLKNPPQKSSMINEQTFLEEFKVGGYLDLPVTNLRANQQVYKNDPGSLDSHFLTLLVQKQEVAQSSYPEILLMSRKYQEDQTWDEGTDDELVGRTIRPKLVHEVSYFTYRQDHQYFQDEYAYNPPQCLLEKDRVQYLLDVFKDQYRECKYCAFSLARCQFADRNRNKFMPGYRIVLYKYSYEVPVQRPGRLNCSKKFGQKSTIEGPIFPDEHHGPNEYFGVFPESLEAGYQRWLSQRLGSEKFCQKQLLTGPMVDDLERILGTYQGYSHKFPDYCRLFNWMTKTEKVPDDNDQEISWKPRKTQSTQGFRQLVKLVGGGELFNSVQRMANNYISPFLSSSPLEWKCEGSADAQYIAIVNAPLIEDHKQALFNFMSKLIDYHNQSYYHDPQLFFSMIKSVRFNFNVVVGGNEIFSNKLQKKAQRLKRFKGYATDKDEQQTKNPKIYVQDGFCLRLIISSFSAPKDFERSVKSELSAYGFKFQNNHYDDGNLPGHRLTHRQLATLVLMENNKNKEKNSVQRERKWYEPLAHDLLAPILRKIEDSLNGHHDPELIEFYNLANPWSTIYNSNQDDAYKHVGCGCTVCDVRIPYSDDLRDRVEPLKEVFGQRLHLLRAHLEIGKNVLDKKYLRIFIRVAGHSCEEILSMMEEHLKVKIESTNICPDENIPPPALADTTPSVPIVPISPTIPVAPTAPVDQKLLDLSNDKIFPELRKTSKVHGTRSVPNLPLSYSRACQRKAPDLPPELPEGWIYLEYFRCP